MKVTVDEQKKDSADEYPKLMISGAGTIVLFYRAGDGVAVKQGRNDTAVGHHSRIWEMKNFTDFHGTITLEND